MGVGFRALGLGGGLGGRFGFCGWRVRVGVRPNRKRWRCPHVRVSLPEFSAGHDVLHVVQERHAVNPLAFWSAYVGCLHLLQYHDSRSFVLLAFVDAKAFRPRYG